LPNAAGDDAPVTRAKIATLEIASSLRATSRDDQKEPACRASSLHQTGVEVPGWVRSPTASPIASGLSKPRRPYSIRRTGTARYITFISSASSRLLAKSLSIILHHPVARSKKRSLIPPHSETIRTRLGISPT
jgi:hypothetical protein